MEDLKSLSDSGHVLQVSNALQKISKSIRRQKIDDKVAEHNIREIEFLKEQCQSPNVQLSLLACQTLTQLSEDAVLQSGRVLTMLISMLPNAR